MNKETIIEKAKKVHEDRYDYSKVVDTVSTQKICVICPTHGEFWQLLPNHLQGHGCPLCGDERSGTFHLSNTEEFVKKARLIHGDKYIYIKAKYKKAKEKICITCPEHGDFWQTPDKHLNGCGCPKCNYSQMERQTEMLLRQCKIDFETQKRFEWLGRQSLDFYLPQYNIAIECQGEQHYFPIKYIGGKEKLKIITERDNRKKALCKDHNVKLFYIKYTENVDDKIKELLEQIC